MSEATLVVMAAGRAKRFGGGKQFFELGPAGETLIDYLLFDAWRAGISRAVLVVRSEDVGTNVARYRERWAGRVAVESAVQDVPLGTGDALLRARPLLDGPFGVANADDFYGRDGLAALAEALARGESGVLVTYPLAETLAESGGVSRGVARVDAKGLLIALEERHELRREGAAVVGARPDPLPLDAPVSMNLWGFPTGAADALSEALETRRRAGGPGELTIPDIVTDCVRAGRFAVRTLPMGRGWIGLTRREDVPEAAARLASLPGYPRPVWAAAVRS